ESRLRSVGHDLRGDSRLARTAAPPHSRREKRRRDDKHHPRDPDQRPHRERLEPKQADTAKQPVDHAIGHAGSSGCRTSASAWHSAAPCCVPRRRALDDAPGFEYDRAMSETIRAPRGSQLSCKGWPQEAALRMLMNNLDPDV